MSNYDRLIYLYRRLREAKAKLEAEHKERLAPIMDKMSQIEHMLLKQMERDGVQNVRTPHGTAYQTTRTSTRVQDKEAFLNHVIENEAWHLLDVRASKTGVRVALEEEGTLPPGVDWVEVRTINVRSS